MSETTAVLRFANHATAIRYVTNLVHLGCNDLEWAETDTAIFLRFRNAPLFPLLTASERNEAECYVESSSGTYAPLGQSASPHDLSSAKDRESLVFLDPKGAFSLQEASFHSVRPEPTLRHVQSLQAIERQPPPIHIPLRFVRSAKHAPPRLWALRGSAGRDVTGALADFARSIPEHQHEQIAFAVLEDARFVFLRTLHGSVLDLSLDPAFYELEHCEGIYLPLGWALSPHLRGPRVEQLAQVETDSLRIFSRPSDSLRVEHGEFSRDGVLLQTVARSAFHPLAEWVDFVVHRAAPFVDAWRNALTFDFAPFVVAKDAAVAREVREAPRPKGDPPNPIVASEARTPSGPRQEANAPALPGGALPPSPVPPPARREGSYEAVAECARLEQAFLASTDAIDAPSRSGLYAQLAEVSNSLGNRRDAALYAARVLWNAKEHEGVPAPNLPPLRQSAEAVQDINDAREHMLHFCTERSPSRASIQAATGLVHRFFDTMDLVSLWNACSKLGRNTGDNLALAQWRDRILVRVRDDEDLRAGWPTVFRAWAFRYGSQELPILEQIQEALGSSARTRSPVEAPIVLTQAYASLILAKAYAYVGRTQESERHALLGRAGLESADPVHQVLRAMFTERIEGVSRTGRSYGPYSTHLESMYLGLDRAARYKIDRLRSALLSLESVERVRPFDSFRSQSVDPSQDEFASLRKPSPETFAANFDAVLTRANAGDDMQRVRIVEGLSDFLARFPPSEASRPILALLSASQSIQADLPRAKTQLRLLSCAAHLSSVQAFEDASGHTLESVARVTERASLVSELLEALPIFLRTGHGEMIRPFLERAAGTAPVDERVLAVGGLARLGVRDFVVPLEEAILHFEKSDSLSKVRQAHLWSRSMAAFPSDIRKEMLRVLLRGFSSISDSYSTNSHFCLSVLEYTEAIAFAVSLPSRTPSVELIDQDERALRKRIERDTARLSVTEDVRSL